MNEKLKEFLESKKEIQRAEFEENKAKTLIDLGLFDKIYAEDDSEFTYEFPESEYDAETSTFKRYKKQAIDITDEEYDELKKYLNYSTDSKTNSIATILTVIAWVVYVCGFISGFVLSDMMLVYWIASFVVGTIYLGFAEIIKLLTAIKNK